MNDWKIYHNPKCSKSRKALEILESNGIKPFILEYLKNPPDKEQLLNLLSQLGGEVRDIIRVSEEAFDPELINLSSSDSVVDAIVANSALLERPIVVRGAKALIARPPERVLELL